MFLLGVALPSEEIARQTPGTQLCQQRSATAAATAAATGNRKAPVTLELLDELRERCDKQHPGSDRHSLAVAETAVVLLTLFRALRGSEAVPDSTARFGQGTNSTRDGFTTV
jgi:hypothetical protein